MSHLEPEAKIFACSESVYLAEVIAKEYGIPLGKVTMAKYSDGEFQPSYEESIRGLRVFIVCSTFPSADNLMELLLLVDAARRASAKYVTVVTPYFGYARQDRKDRPRVAIGAKLVANLITAAGANRLMTCDLHAGQIQGFFDIPVDHLDGSFIFIPYLKTLKLKELVFAAPDVGGTGRARGFAKHFTVDMVICDKYRKRANEVASMQVIGNVESKDVIIVDDMIDTGGTLSTAANIIMEKGAKSVRAICTHPVLSGNAYDTIEQSALEELVVTDTIPLTKDSPKIKVLTVSDLFAKGIRKTHNHESISSLFIH